MVTATWLDIDVARVAAQIENAIRSQVLSLHRRGIVVGLSGGIDSSVVTALVRRALGPERVLALLMPERDSSSESLTLGRLRRRRRSACADVVEDIAPTLDAARLLQPAGRSDPHRVPGVRRRLQVARSRCRRSSTATA